MQIIAKKCKKSLLIILTVCILNAVLVFNRQIAYAEDEAPAYYYMLAEPNIDQAQIALTINANTGSNTVNAVRTVISFDPALVQAQSIMTDDSICDVFLEKEIDNINGTITLSCGKPSPGFQGEGIIGRVDFKITTWGMTPFIFSEGTMMLANDGYATNIMEMAIGKTLIIE
jgi:hypothetical protein